MVTTNYIEGKSTETPTAREGELTLPKSARTPSDGPSSCVAIVSENIKRAAQDKFVEHFDIQAPMCKLPFEFNIHEDSVYDTPLCKTPSEVTINEETENEFLQKIETSFSQILALR